MFKSKTLSFATAAAGIQHLIHLCCTYLLSITEDCTTASVLESTARCSCLPPPPLRFYFFVWKLKVSQVMTGLGSVRGKRQLCAFQLALWFISFPVLGLSSIKPKPDWFSFTQKEMDEKLRAKKRTAKFIYTSLRLTHSTPESLQHHITPEIQDICWDVR